jgi:hypothetical protein
VCSSVLPPVTASAVSTSLRAPAACWCARMLVAVDQADAAGPAACGRGGVGHAVGKLKVARETLYRPAGLVMSRSDLHSTQKASPAAVSCLC